MAAELELAAWGTGGDKLWSRFVEPPWEFGVEGEVVAVNVMGSVSRSNSGAVSRPNLVLQQTTGACRVVEIRRPLSSRGC
jgi:hypothetical protein